MVADLQGRAGGFANGSMERRHSGEPGRLSPGKDPDNQSGNFTLRRFGYQPNPRPFEHDID